MAEKCMVFEIWCFKTLCLMLGGMHKKSNEELHLYESLPSLLKCLFSRDARCGPAARPRLHFHSLLTEGTCGVKLRSTYWALSKVTCARIRGSPKCCHPTISLHAFSRVLLWAITKTQVLRSAATSNSTGYRFIIDITFWNLFKLVYVPVLV